MFSSHAQARAVAITALVVLLSMSLLVIRMSSAAFTATPPTTGNAWQSGQLALTTSSAISMFPLDDARLLPGQTVSRCIVVTYHGDESASVRLQNGNSAGDVTGSTQLRNDLALVVRRGTGGGAGGDCSGFVSTETLTPPSSTLASFESLKTWEQGRGTWQPVPGTPAPSAVYRFDVTLSTSSEEQGAAVGNYVFRWEAQPVHP